MKPIRLTIHVEKRARLRGATRDEITETIRTARWSSAFGNKLLAKKRFAFDQQSPVNQKQYRYKKVEAIFVDEPKEIVVITVKVYYSNEE